MPLKFSVLVRNAELDAIESSIGASAILKLRTGAPPTNILDADSGTVVATLNLPSDWMNAASSGSKIMAGVWQDSSADSTGIVGHFRLYASNGITQHIQGTAGNTGSGADIELDNVNVNATQSITITAFNLTAGNA
jgi:hypothetical protein